MSTNIKNILVIAITFAALYGIAKWDSDVNGAGSSTPSTSSAGGVTTTSEGSNVVAIGDGTRAIPVSEQSVTTTLIDDKIKAKIQDHAIDDLTDTSQYPSLNRQLGKKGIREAMAGSWAAAYRAAKSSECDSVNTSAPSDYPDRKFKDHHEFFTNCDNGKQWKFKAAELKDKKGRWYTAENAPEAGVSETDRRKYEQSALQASAPGSVRECSELLKHDLKFPASAKIHDIAGASVDFNMKDERFVNIELKAKNSYGNELTYTGQCIFHHNGKITVQFFKR